MIRVRELKYPIAVFDNQTLCGGRDAGYGSHRRWNVNIAEYHHEGNYDLALIYDADGGKFVVEKITLTSPTVWQITFGFMIGEDNRKLANVDMELRQIGTLSLAEFQAEIIETLHKYAHLWSGFCLNNVVQDLFKGKETFKDSINAIGSFNQTNGQGVKGKSTKIVDLR